MQNLYSFAPELNMALQCILPWQLMALKYPASYAEQES